MGEVQPILTLARVVQPWAGTYNTQTTQFDKDCYLLFQHHGLIKSSCPRAVPFIADRAVPFIADGKIHRALEDAATETPLE